MSHDTITKEDKQTPRQRAQKAIHLSALTRVIREIVAVVLWLAILIQLFVIDISGYVSTYLPAGEFVIRFRFLILLAVIAISWPVLRNRRFVLIIGFIIGYPLVLFFWRIPRLLFRNWPLVVVFAPAIHHVATTFKVSFLLFVAALVSSFIVCLVSSKVLVVSCVIILCIYLIRHYVRRFRMAFSPSTVFADASGHFRNIWKKIKCSDMYEFPKGLAPESDEYKQKLGQKLLGIYASTTFLHIVGERLREIVNSRKLDLYFVGSLLYKYLTEDHGFTRG